ncbi:MAG: endonuclease III, partial [Dysgonamonadaceae bacterium]
MTKKERYAAVLNWFQENTESAETELKYENNYQLLIAVI